MDIDIHLKTGLVGGRKSESVLNFFTTHGFTLIQIFTTSSKEIPGFLPVIPKKTYFSQSFNFYSPKVLLIPTLFVWL
ncbi:unnamed protein product [Trifolium pratense]|uniref:Uncharacterized protein n=1 Tax=Trifolium pratense TaxID=57577 RepID=A0ACB0L162_TRIPR|nr:unnamed protein product [Trifolium pratense]